MATANPTAQTPTLPPLEALDRLDRLRIVRRLLAHDAGLVERIDRVIRRGL